MRQPTGIRLSMFVSVGAGAIFALGGFGGVLANSKAYAFARTSSIPSSPLDIWFIASGITISALILSVGMWLVANPFVYTAASRRDPLARNRHYEIWKLVGSLVFRATIVAFGIFIFMGGFDLGGDRFHTIAWLIGILVMAGPLFVKTL